MTIRLLLLDGLDPGPLRAQFNHVTALLEAGNFRAADVKKLEPGPYYRAKLSAADRLIFRFVACRGHTCLALLEIVRHHAYAASRFLRGVAIDEGKLHPLPTPAPVASTDVATVPYLHPARRHIQVLDKILSFDDHQAEALAQRPPLILIGSAGSGKTVLTLEKLRQLAGEILYVTRSPFLVDNARSLYYAHHYENDAQEVAFLSLAEYVESIAALRRRPLTFAEFAAWFAGQRGATPLRDAHALYEEFNGVLTGSAVTAPYLALDDYLALGVRRSIFTGDDRPRVYDLFRRYLDFVRTGDFYDLNIACHERLDACAPLYDFIVADEVQDLTTVQVNLILKALRQPDQFVLCGDANQIVHPNFFSWAGVKSLFYEQRLHGRRDIIRILNSNYRNTPQVTELANRLLLIKHARFGSIDRESHYLVKPVSDEPGIVEFLPDTPDVRREIDAKTRRSARVAVLVMREEDKPEARASFRTPLVFSVREAKGLEYENIILLNFVSSQARAFRDIVDGVRADDLAGDFDYARAADKQDKSLEILKFYVNALYVAVTRAVRNVYLIEHTADHPLLALLRVRRARDTCAIAAEESTESEWQAEALRLERQGKTEQVAAIRKAILKQEPVPWTVLTPDAAAALAQSALTPETRDTKTRQLLLDYAVTYNAPRLLRQLGGLAFRPAHDLPAARTRARNHYAQDYHQRGYRDLRRKMQRHGVDFRDPLNRTPLMMATRLGLPALVQELVEAGASPLLRDSWGRIPLQIALRAAYANPLYARGTLGQVYAAIVPRAAKVLVGDRLVKLDAHRMEFFLLHSMLALFERIVRAKLPIGIPAFETADFVAALRHFPEAVIPERRRTRQAITAALARNEVFRDAPGNRRLFVRVRRGYYIPNPCMDIEYDDATINICDVMHFDTLNDERDDPRMTAFLDMVERTRAAVSDVLAHGDAPGAPRAAAPVPPSASRLAGTLARQAEPHAAASLEGERLASRLSPPGAREPDGTPRHAEPDTAGAASADASASTLSAETAQAIQQLHGPPRQFPDVALVWLARHGDEAVPSLLDILEKTIADPARAVAGDFAHLFAIYLLAQMREPRAYPLFIRLAAMPEAEALLDDAITEDLDRLLASVCGQDDAPLIELAANRKANAWSRAAAIDALVLLVLHCGYERRRAIEHLRCLMTAPASSLERKPSAVWQAIADAAVALQPIDLLEELADAVREGLIDDNAFSRRRLVPVARRPIDKVLAASKRWRAGLIDDAIDEMSQWDCFRKPRPRRSRRKPARAMPTPIRTFEAEFTAPHGPERALELARLAARGVPDMPDAETVHAEAKPGRNAPCPCGSGKKYKKCCGA